MTIDDIPPKFTALGAAGALLAAGIAGYRLGKSNGGPMARVHEVTALERIRDKAAAAPAGESLDALASTIDLSDLEAARDEMDRQLDDHSLDEMAAFVRSNAVASQPVWRREFVARAVAEYLGEADPDTALDIASAR